MPPQTPRPTPSSRHRDSSPWDSSPNCKYALPTANVQELKRELKYRPLSTDFWIPIPSRAIITAFLNATPVPLVLERDQAVRTEHKMAGLIHGVLLRHFLIRQLRVMLYDDDGGDVKGGGAAVAQRRRGSGRRQQADAEESPRRRRRSRCKAVIALLKRDVRDLEVEYIFHWFDLRSAEYMTRLKAEVEEGWERHAGPGAGMWTMRSAAPVVKRKDLTGARAPAADQTAPTADQAAPTADQGAGTRALITSRAAQIG